MEMFKMEEDKLFELWICSQMIRGSSGPLPRDAVPEQIVNWE